MKILGTIDTSYEISRIINEANEFLLIVSPYLRITASLKVDIEECLSRCKWNMIVYRENHLSKDEFIWLKKKKNLQLVSIENLHAKCYVNEERALLSSMNLYEYSQINNHELSVLFSAKEDADSYYALNTRISKILKSKNETLDMGYLFQFGPYQMKHLYIELDAEYYFPKKPNGRDANYRFICEEAKKIVDFQEDDFYEDGSAILRNTLLGKEKFDLLYNTISRLGTPKVRKMMD